jgi:DNA repair exonuclease SbcCD ATPase subunit
MHGGRCPLCKSLLTKSNLAHLREIHASAVGFSAQLGENCRKDKKLHSKLVKMRNSVQQKLNKSPKLMAIKMKYQNKINELNKRDDDINRLKKLKKSYKDKANAELSSIKTDIGKKKDDLKYYKDFDVSNLDDLKDKFELLRDKKRKLDLKLMNVESDLDRHKKYYGRIKKLKNMMGDDESRLNSYKWWYNAYPKIKLEIIKEAMPFVESEANKYLSQILPGKIIRINMDVEKSINKLNVEIFDYEHKVKRIFEGWSGGEKDKLSLALNLALNRLASLRSGKEPKFIILDEKFARIDSESRNLVFEMLKDECEDRKVFAISHVEGIDSEFSQIVSVNKVKHISEIKIGTN